MMRLLWALLAMGCTAFAQVQPMAAPVPLPEDCCCGAACACGPECPDVATIPVGPRAADRGPALAEVRQCREVARPTLAPRSPAPALVTVSSTPTGAPAACRAAAVPLFRRHCAFLI